MSEKMTRIPYDTLLAQVCHEYETYGTIFGVSHIWKPKRKTLPIFGTEKLETPFGPAAGPNTQLAQNIIAAYAAGARFFELKTVQIMDGSVEVHPQPRRYDISSTQIREALGRGQLGLARRWLHRAVFRYVLQHRLFQL